VDATPLDRIIRRGPQPPADVLLRVTQVAGALDFAAAAGIHHGALHPRDILLGVDRTLVTGLGVVQALSQADVDVPMSGATASPQRALGQPVTHADDIFALAAIAFEMLYGRPLDDRSRLTSFVTPLAGLDHVRLRDVLARSVADDPAERPATALEFAAGLQYCIVNLKSTRQDSDSYANSESAAAAVMPAPTQMPIPVDDLPLRTVHAALLDQPSFEPESDSVADSRNLHSHVNPSPQVNPNLDASPNLHVNSIPRVNPTLPANSNPAVSNAEFASESRAAFRGFEFESRAQAQPRSLWLPIASAVAIAFLFGFASGFIVGQRDDTPAPRSAERAIPLAERQRAERQRAEEAMPAPTIGQDFTESAVPQEIEGRRSDGEGGPQVVDDAAVLPTEREPSPRTSNPESEEARAVTPADRVPPGATSMEVISRPAGAQVYVDGRLVGKTPLVLPEVNPGDHAVQIALPGHQRWVTRVSVSPGSRARVAASLER
jgi:hypothetical protein